MSYHPNIPQPGDDPTVSQGQLLDNFGKINTDFSVNHVALTAGGNNGFHTLVQFTNVLATDPAVSGVQSAVYPKSVNGSPQLFFRNISKIYPLTGLNVVNGTITGISKAVNAQVTSNGHALQVGNTITISNVSGMTQVNGNTYTVTSVINANVFAINVNSTGFGTYTGGGTWNSASSTRYGFITPWGWTVNCGKFTVATGNAFALNFSIPYSTGFNTYCALLTPDSGLTQFGVISVTTTVLNMATSTAGRNFYYLVIGST